MIPVSIHGLRRSFAIAACLAVAACSPAAPIGSATPSVPPPGDPAGPSFPSREPPLGTPPPLTLPLRPEFPAAFTIPSSRAILTVSEGDDMAGTHRVLTVYDDGSALQPWVPEFGGPGVRRLSDQGLAHLWDRMSATGAFDRSRSFPPPSGWAGGFAGYDFDDLSGASPVRVSVTNASADPMAHRLMALGDAMRDLASLLPQGADWAGGDATVHPFEPASALVLVQQVSTGGLLLDLPDERVDVLAGRLPGPVDSLGAGVTAPDGTRSARCAVVDGRAAIALQEEAARRFDVMETGLLIDAIPPFDHPTLGGVDLRSEDGAAIVRIAWRAARPGEALRCDGTALPAAPAPGRYQARGADMVLGSTGGIGGATGIGTRLAVQVSSDEPQAMSTMVFYLDDGTVVTFPPRAPLAGFGIRRQTEAGTSQLEEIVGAAALPDTERHPETTVDGPTRMYAVIFPDNRVVEASDRERGLEAHRIVDLVRRLIDPDTAFPASAWRDPRPLPYRPDEVAVTTQFSEASVAPRATLSMIAPPFEPSSFGEPSTADPAIRCRVMAMDDATALARSLRAVTVPNGDRFTFATGTARQIVEIAFELRGPMDTPPSCN